MSQKLLQNLGSPFLHSLNQQFTTLPKYTLADIGFQFVLLDAPSQVHIILTNFVEYVYNQDPPLAVELTKLIFNLALSDFDQAYKLRSNNEIIISIVRESFEQMGLVEFTTYDPDKFYVTQLMQSFLLSEIGSQSEQANAEKFIIVETNFRVFAYTHKKLYREILKLFLEPNTEFANMFYG